MKVLLAGGGSGGHVTPLRAIVEALRGKSKVPLDIAVITDVGFYQETQAVFQDAGQVKLKKIFSGKYRRYKSKSFIWHIVHLSTLLKNIRDVFLLGVGAIQSIVYFVGDKPDVVFCKGGFVCVPVGLAAHLFGVPLIIHDSDTRPGLTNRFLSRWAAKIGTGMPTDFYPYPKNLMEYVGIPVNADFKPVTVPEQRKYKESLNLPSEQPLLLVTGGGNGAISLNKQLMAVAPQLLRNGWSIAHLAGRGKTEPVMRVREQLSKVEQKSWLIEEFAPMIPRLLAADVVVSRTSASTLQECANAQKAVVGIASEHLDDQKMNAELFDSKGAIISLDESSLSADGSELLEVVTNLHKDVTASQKLAKNLHSSFAKPQAAAQIAALLIDAAHSH